MVVMCQKEVTVTLGGCGNVIFILILIAEVVLFFSFLRKNRRQTVVSI
jgi:hypothetical protein